MGVVTVVGVVAALPAPAVLATTILVAVTVVPCRVPKTTTVWPVAKLDAASGAFLVPKTVVAPICTVSVLPFAVVMVQVAEPIEAIVPRTCGLACVEVVPAAGAWAATGAVVGEVVGEADAVLPDPPDTRAMVSPTAAMATTQAPTTRGRMWVRKKRRMRSVSAADAREV